MKIKQFEDKPLAHYSYAIVSEGEMALVDPSRNPLPYYAYAEENKARIVAVFETHPHADFVSSHLQIHKETGATIYTSKQVGADYPHKTFDDGDELQLGAVRFSSLNTPGHSPDGISILAKSSDNEYAIFTGDTLFIGDVGRPDLREKAGNIRAKREELAKMMYHTIREKFSDLPDRTLVYPAHGAGSLCGKNLSSDASSTLGNERMGNWAFRDQSETEFVEQILKEQPFIPAYFGYDVSINKRGAENLGRSMARVPLLIGADNVEDDILVVDTRAKEEFKKNHLPGSVNIMATGEDDKFETWLGTLVQPGEPFYLVVQSAGDKDYLLQRIAKIGYEQQMKGVVTLSEVTHSKSAGFDYEAFKGHPDNFTILDIRNASEVREGRYFSNSINIPLPELRAALDEIPRDKPIVVHCAGGYRSAAGSSIVDGAVDEVPVYDLSDRVNEFQKK